MVDMEATHMQSKELNRLATELVGDSQKPNLYFVSIEGNITLVTSEFDTAYDMWRYLPRDIETALEDRLTGCLASTAPIEDGSSKLITHDDTYMLERR
jgi:hypothetical protein